MNRIKRVMAITLAVVVMMAFTPFIADLGEAQAASKPGKVKITKATRTNQMVDLKWKKAKGAKKYYVYMKKGKGKWKKVKTLKGTKFKKNGLKWKTMYYFKVRAVNGKKKGKFSKVYRGRIRSKVTLQGVATAAEKSGLNANAQEVKNDVNNNAGYELITKAAASIEKNNIVFRFTMAVSSDMLTLSEQQSFKNSMMQSMESAATKKAAHKEIVTVQNKVGLVGITEQFIFVTTDNVTLYSVKYK